MPISGAGRPFLPKPCQDHVPPWGSWHGSNVVQESSDLLSIQSPNMLSPAMLGANSEPSRVASCCDRTVRRVDDMGSVQVSPVANGSTIRMSPLWSKPVLQSWGPTRTSEFHPEGHPAYRRHFNRTTSGTQRERQFQSTISGNWDVDSRLRNQINAATPLKKTRC